MPDSVLSQYAITGEKAAQMFPERQKKSGADIPRSTGAMNPTKMSNAESLGEVESYSDICVYRQLSCNPYGCWWVYYWASCN